jgi:hypothetical protein
MFRGCLFGLFSAFHKKKLPNRNKGLALDAGFAKTEAGDRHRSQSTF